MGSLGRDRGLAFRRGKHGSGHDNHVGISWACSVTFIPWARWMKHIKFPEIDCFIQSLICRYLGYFCAPDRAETQRRGGLWSVAELFPASKSLSGENARQNFILLDGGDVAAHDGETGRRSPRLKRGEGSNAICRFAVKVTRPNGAWTQPFDLIFQYLFTNLCQKSRLVYAVAVTTAAHLRKAKKARLKYFQNENSALNQSVL